MTWGMRICLLFMILVEAWAKCCSLFDGGEEEERKDEYGTVRILDTRRRRSNVHKMKCDYDCEFYTHKNAKENIQGFDAELLSRHTPRPKGLLTVALSMESTHDLNVLESKYNATMLTSLGSTIPIPYLRKTSILKWGQAPIFDYWNASALFLGGRCTSKNKREEIVLALNTFLKVDRPGNCLKNQKWPLCHNISCSKHALIRRYPFYFAFEYLNRLDYVTEKVFDALEMGVLPIYYGAANIDAFVPPHSIIKVSDFASLQDLGLYLQKMNKTEYLRYFEWKHHELPIAFRQRFNFIRTSSSCRLCRWVHTKKLNRTWNQATQKMCPQSIIVVTAANSFYMKPALNLALSARHFGADQVWLYDLGGIHQSSSRAFIKTCSHFLHILKHPNNWFPEWSHNVKDFAWKALVIYDAVHRAQGPIFYEDAGSEFRGPIYPLFNLICKQGYILFKGQDNSARRWTHPQAAQCLGFPNKDSLLKGKTSFHAGSIGIDYQSQAYYDLILPWFNASHYRDCIAPSTSNLANHRQDQAALTLIAYAHNYTRHYTRLMLNSADFLAHRPYSPLEPAPSVSLEGSLVSKIIYVARGRTDSQFTKLLLSSECSPSLLQSKNQSIFL